MTLQAGKRQARSGETISVPVYLIRGAGVANMNFNVFYDPRVAIGQGAKKGGLIPSGAPFEQNSGQKGMVRLGFAGNKDFGGTGQVAEILFKIEGKPGVKTPLKLAVTTIAGASGGRPAIATIDGEIEIVEAAASSPQSVPQTPPSTPAAPQQPATPISPAKSGDCNADGRLNSADALCALQMSVGLKPADTQVDMDEDGQVTSSDARLILQKVVGK